MCVFSFHGHLVLKSGRFEYLKTAQGQMVIEHQQVPTVQHTGYQLAVKSCVQALIFFNLVLKF